MSRVIIVTGIPGTGKSTVCNELLKLAEQSGKKLSLINFGTVMVELSKKRGKNFHRDQLRKSELLFQRDLQVETAESIAQKIAETDGDVIIDTHMSIKTKNGYMAGLPSHILQILKPNFFVLVEAEPNEVLSRRIKDTTRERDKALKEEIAEEFLFSRLIAASCAVLTGAPVKIVENPSGKQVEAAKEILKLLE